MSVRAQKKIKVFKMNVAAAHHTHPNKKILSRLHGRPRADETRTYHVHWSKPALEPLLLTYFTQYDGLSNGAIRSGVRD